MHLASEAAGAGLAILLVELGQLAGVIVRIFEAGDAAKLGDGHGRKRGYFWTTELIVQSGAQAAGGQVGDPRA
uniref:hypothetical protein n=1 Tax=Cupriavidus yeoncheonensis TaxID=1462994 RepID=UPI003F4963A6